jgi:hypothetical protein
LGSRSKGQIGGSIGRYWIHATPRSTFAVFRPGPSGFLSPPLQPGFYAGRSPPCKLPSSTKPTNHPSTAPSSAIESAPLLRFGPLQRATVPGARMTRSFQPPAHSVLRVSHPLDVFLLPKPCGACFIPAALMGFPWTSSPALARVFRLVQGDGAHASSSRLSLPPR